MFVPMLFFMGVESGDATRGSAAAAASADPAVPVEGQEGDEPVEPEEQGQDEEQGPLPALVPKLDEHSLCAAAYFGICMARCSPVLPRSQICYVFETAPLNGACSDPNMAEPIACAWIVGFKYYSQLWAVCAAIKRCGPEELGLSTLVDPQPIFHETRKVRGKWEWCRSCCIPLKQ